MVIVLGNGIGDPENAVCISLCDDAHEKGMKPGILIL